MSDNALLFGLTTIVLGAAGMGTLVVPQRDSPQRPGSAPEKPSAASGSSELSADRHPEPAWMVQTAVLVRSPLVHATLARQQPQLTPAEP